MCGLSEETANINLFLFLMVLGKLWRKYDKLSMRLRLGSAQNESINDALDMIHHKKHPNDFDGKNMPKWFLSPPHSYVAVDVVCTASALLEASPEFAGMTSIADC
jgi:hypothetical protein